MSRYKRPILGLYLSFLTVVAVHGIFDLAPFIHLSSLSSDVCLPLKHSMIAELFC